ncbi:MAG: hypothetical protein VCA34_00965, partial [Roseibacillus sp.]
LQARGKPGVVVTRPFEVEGDRLQVNVDATAGRVRVELLDAQGNPIPSFSGDAAKIYRGVDQLRMEPAWGNQAGLSSLKGQWIRLRFHLDNARLYSFQILPGQP